MAKYNVKVTPRALRDLDGIYSYIAKEILEPETASNMIGLLEEAILSLEELPYRGAERKIGAYANKGYRQLFVKNYTIVYAISESKRQVIIYTVKYTPSKF